MNDFTIEYLPNGQVSQFFSDLSVVDSKNGRETSEDHLRQRALREGGGRCTRRIGRSRPCR